MHAIYIYVIKSPAIMRLPKKKEKKKGNPPIDFDLKCSWTKHLLLWLWSLHAWIFSVCEHYMLMFRFCCIFCRHFTRNPPRVLYQREKSWLYRALYSKVLWWKQSNCRGQNLPHPADCAKLARSGVHAGNLFNLLQPQDSGSQSEAQRGPALPVR